MLSHLRFLLAVNIDRTPCPSLRSKPSLVVGMPVLRATFVFKPLIPTARFSENDNPFMILMVKLLAFRHTPLYCKFVINVSSVVSFTALIPVVKSTHLPVRIHLLP